MERTDRLGVTSFLMNDSAGHRPTINPTMSPLITYEQFLTFLMYISPLTIAICTVGIFSNIINIVVFYKMGLTSSANTSLFSLAIADACNVSAVLVMSFENMFDDSQLPMKMSDITLLTSHAYYFFSAMCSWITTIISMERTCCIIFPMKVKQIFTQKTILSLIAGMLIYQTCTGLPKSFATGLSRTISPLTNRTLIFFDFSKLDAFMFKTSMLISLSIPNLICFTIVLVGTVFFIINFKQSRKLRNSMRGSGGISDKTSDKDARLIRLVICICIIYIVGAAPNVGVYLAETIYPPLHVSNPYLGYFIHACYIVCNLFQATASSVNIFVYFGMGSKFMQTFKEIFLYKAN